MKAEENFEDNDIKTVTIKGVYGHIVYNLSPVTMEGQLLDLREDSILLEPERLRINFNRLPVLLREHVKAFISAKAAKWANVTLNNCFNLLVAQFKEMDGVSIAGAGEIIDATVRKFMEENNASSSKSNLRTFYSWCVDNSAPFFDEDFYDLYLNTLVFGSDEGKGLDVRVAMANRGPLTVSESKAFRNVLGGIDIDSLSTGELQGLVAIKLGQVLGLRDVQVTKLQFKHFGCSEDGTYFLDVPRAKQRGARKKKVTKRRPITKSAANLIIHLKARYKVHKNVDEEWPIITTFTSKQIPKKERVTADIFMVRRRAIELKLDLSFKVTNRRLRKSFCTQLIARGVPLVTVAELMDHSDLQQLEAYFQQTEHIANKLDEVLMEEASEILDIFSGKIVSNEDASKKGQTIFASISRKLHKIGSCASEKPCMLAPPLSCYGCSSLEAFIEVDHGAVVDELVAETKRTFGESHSIEILQNEEFLHAAKFVENFKENA